MKFPASSAAPASAERRNKPMAKKRGTSGISRIIAIDKPVGKSSHDMVNDVRRIYDERRVGHTGTLDPLASGVLTICVGPAARLDAYLVDHDKSYVMDIVFGYSTTTDDAEGELLETAKPDQKLFDSSFAEETVRGLVGKSIQVPPAYSAIKVSGTKAYEAARKGQDIVLEARPFEIYEARLEALDVRTESNGDKLPVWRVFMHVSKGTYMRSIARDLGRKLGCPAHCGALRRTQVGKLDISDCVSIEELQAEPNVSVVDPLLLLGIRWAFANDYEQKIANGALLSPRAIKLNEPIEEDIFSAICCTSSVFPSTRPLEDGEVIGLCVGHELRALYVYQESKNRLKPQCVFAQGVERGTGL